MVSKIYAAKVADVAIPINDDETNIKNPKEKKPRTQKQIGLSKNLY